jgi:hypothetical protein
MRWILYLAEAAAELISHITVPDRGVPRGLRGFAPEGSAYARSVKSRWRASR